ncbi:MAG: cytochrome C oxidase subunit IV family protein [Longimicrobiales bacterium]|nr:cytochrome C oxidase subunit IV family protein [Longimicrobiales bacterium]
MAHDAHSSHGEHGHGEEGHEGGHASVGFYWAIGGILAVLTAVEVALYYMKPPLEHPLLIFLSAVKFVLVVGFFMHLKFDSKVFTSVFMAGLVLAIFMVTALVLLYHYVPTGVVPTIG